MNLKLLSFVKNAFTVNNDFQEKMIESICLHLRFFFAFSKEYLFCDKCLKCHRREDKVEKTKKKSFQDDIVFLTHWLIKVTKVLMAKLLVEKYNGTHDGRENTIDI